MPTTPTDRGIGGGAMKRLAGSTKARIAFASTVTALLMGDGLAGASAYSA